MTRSSMTLDDLVETAVRDGRLVNLTLFRTAQGWQASISTGVSAWKVEIADTAVSALRGALGEKPGRAENLFG